MTAKKKKLATILALMSAAVIFVPTIFAANTSSAYAYSSISYGGNAVILNDTCPVIVEEENLTFNITELPNGSNAIDKDEFLNYNANLVTEYNLFNPENYDVTLSLAFPLPQYPYYGYTERDSNGTYTIPAEVDKYDVTLDGQKIEKAFYYTYGDMSYLSSETSEQLYKQKIRLKGNGHEHVNTNATVTTISYNADISSLAQQVSTKINNQPDTTTADISTTGAVAYKYFAISQITMPKDNILYVNENCFYTDYSFDGDNVTLKVVIPFNSQTTFNTSISIIGEITSKPEFYICDTINSELPFGKCNRTGEEQQTFSDYALDYKQLTNISDENWINIFADMLETSYSQDVPFFLEYYETSNISCWYLYDITVPAKTNVVNTVTTPLYPAISGGTSTNYVYNFNLLPARDWADFNVLNVVINTSYDITTIPDFTKTDVGYKYTSNGINSDSIYILITKQGQHYASEYITSAIVAIIYAVLVMIPIKFLAAGITLLIYVAKKK